MLIVMLSVKFYGGEFDKGFIINRWFMYGNINFIFLQLQLQTAKFCYDTHKY